MHARLNRSERWLLLASCRWIEDYQLRFATLAWPHNEEAKTEALYFASKRLKEHGAVEYVARAVGPSRHPGHYLCQLPEFGGFTKWLADPVKYVVPSAETEAAIAAAMRPGAAIGDVAAEVNFDVELLRGDMRRDLASLEEGPPATVDVSSLKESANAAGIGQVGAVFLSPMLILCSAMIGGMDAATCRSLAQAFAVLVEDTVEWRDQLVALTSLG